MSYARCRECLGWMYSNLSPRSSSRVSIRISFCRGAQLAFATSPALTLRYVLFFSPFSFFFLSFQIDPYAPSGRC